MNMVASWKLATDPARTIVAVKASADPPIVTGCTVRADLAVEMLAILL